MNKKKYFVTGISTDSGKTVVAAILTEALQADYWKPVQAGYPTDTETVGGLISNSRSRLHPEGYLLQMPASPHAAAKNEGITIDIERLLLPATDNDLVIEGAGGVLVPLNEEDFVIDLAARLEAEIVLVSNHYLGSINHTLLTVRELRHRKLPIRGIIFNGPPNPETERIILQHTGLSCLLRIGHYENINKEIIKKYADELALVLGKGY